jgi:hypothetical protein
VLLTIAVSVLLSPLYEQRAHAAPVLTYSCTPGAADCRGWYRTSVTVRWGWFTGSTEYFAGECEPNAFGNPWATFVADTAGRETWCEVRDVNTGEKTKHTIVLHIDKTPPTVFAGTSRPPDYGGWFNHPVDVAFSGSDATSRVASCTSSTYAGPDQASVTVGGSCQDNAGNVATGALVLNYDASPPPAPSVAAMPGDGKVALIWTATADSQAEVVRTGGEEAPTVVYRGPGGAFTDGSVRNERRYRYVVTLIDQAGNRAAGDTHGVPTASKLLLPSDGARLGRRAASAPLLVWKAVRRARYYNVQLFRERKKILSAWPKQPRLQLKREWRYRGKQYHLLPARYCWRVWPGFGKRSAHRYGKQLGKKCFRVTR